MPARGISTAGDYGRPMVAPTRRSMGGYLPSMGFHRPKRWYSPRFVCVGAGIARPGDCNRRGLRATNGRPYAAIFHAVAMVAPTRPSSTPSQWSPLRSHLLRRRNGRPYAAIFCVGAGNARPVIKKQTPPHYSHIPHQRQHVAGGNILFPIKIFIFLQQPDQGVFINITILLPIIPFPPYHMIIKPFLPDGMRKTFADCALELPYDHG